ncbi:MULTISPECIES: fatty acid desaturase family protein [Psychrobacter]|uniref:Fatty acid desaturase n=1 Tax=Psychrobacter alimentarius TaxID=261164 RepID=A0ABN4N6Q7_9GAMM|nr:MULTISPECIES: fatty acid desaturase [Psychrobacter]AMT98287.1 fatty acid desaturase [Psychrobacter alimentarius]QCB31930.1 fatty acid desaturase [Psychrobacter sp. PAMC27889]
MKANNVYKHEARQSVIKQSLGSVEWQDLRQLTRCQIVYNTILPYPFLLLSWWFASQSWYVMACGASYLFFAAAFRQAHDGYHHSLGTGKRVTTALLLLLSVLLLTSLHSIRATHMEHHRDPLGDSDMEGSLAKLSWWQAMLGGVTYRLDIYRQGLRLSSQRNQRIIWLEFGLIALVIMVTLTLMGLTLFNVSAITLSAQVSMYHLFIMMLANASVGIIAVWGVHHDCDEAIARTERNPVVNLLTFNLLYHVEHHLFPAVPSNHLPELAKRLDRAAPHLTKLHVLPNQVAIMRVIDNRWKNMKKVRRNSKDENECPIRRHFA